jgi:hypothetical protein
MPNEYKSFYFADLKAIIREVALDTMLVPSFGDENKTLQNAMIVGVYNDGIRTLADMLIDRLTKEATETENK